VQENWKDASEVRFQESASEENIDGLMGVMGFTLVRTMPFGVPVGPLVYMMQATFSGFGEI
jgi:hypothetical protein